MPLQDVYGRCLRRALQAVVGASSVEWPDSWVVDLSYIIIHTRPTVPRDPPPEVYRDVGDALQTLIVLKTIGGG